MGVSTQQQSLEVILISNGEKTLLYSNQLQELNRTLTLDFSVSYSFPLVQINTRKHVFIALICSMAFTVASHSTAAQAVECFIKFSTNMDATTLEALR